MDPRSEKIGALFANLNDHAAVEEILSEIYHPQVVFQDPIQRVEGVGALCTALRSMEKKLKGMTVRLKGDAVSERTLAIYWEMDFSTPFTPRRATLPGISWLEFDSDGKCIRHTDFWDMLGMSADLMPLFRPLRFFLRQMAK